MIKKIAVVLAIIGAVAIGLRFLSIQHTERYNAKWAQADAKLGAHVTRAKKSCEIAVTGALAPARVLDFPYDDGNGISSTDSGYSYILVADTGDTKSRVKCYMDRNYQILQLVQQ